MGVFGDFYNTNGTKIGTDGNNDGKKYVLTDSNDISKAQQSYFGKGIGGFFNKLFGSGGKGTIGTSSLNNPILLPSNTALKESLNTLDRTIANGGLREESSLVMKDGTVVRGQTGPLHTITNNIQTAPSSLPNLPAGATIADVEATIHAHPTTVQQVGNQIYPQSASTPSTGIGADGPTFQQYNTNIIVGPLGTVSNVTTNTDGTPNIPNRTNGAVIYDANSNPKVELSRNAIDNILKNEK